MRDWGFWEWLGYGLLAVAAVSVLFVPKEAVALLRSKGIKFVEQPIVELPTAKQRTLHSRECLA